MDSIEQKKKEMQAVFDAVPLPKEKEEAWRYTFVEKLQLQAFLELHEPAIVLSSLSKESADKGVIFCDMHTAIRRHPEIVARHFLHNIKVDDKFLALAASHYKNGVFLYVPKNVQVTEPLQATMRMVSNCAIFNLIIMEKGSFASYLEEYAYESAQESLGVSLGQVCVEENAKLDFHYLCLSSPLQRSVHSIKANVKKNGSINWFWGGFGGKLNRVRIDSILEGEGASSKNVGIFVGKLQEHLDATTNVYHKAEHTTNNMEVNGIMKDASSAIYRGLIKIEKNARDTNSYLSNHVLKISEKAIANSIPALEIDNNEVKASHGATVGQIDDEQLFYLRSRGLSREEAEHLIVKGFLMPLVEKISIESFKEKFAHALEKEA
jgi:Fe-S cluster assembly protein SufD